MYIDNNVTQGCGSRMGGKRGTKREQNVTVDAALDLSRLLFWIAGVIVYLCFVFTGFLNC